VGRRSTSNRNNTETTEGSSQDDALSFARPFFIDRWIPDIRGETRLSGTIKAGTIVMRAGTIIPQSLRVETEPFSQGWEIIKNSDGNSVDRDIRRADWNFFFLVANIQATAMGYWGERTVRRAMERVLAKAAGSKFNCLEITEVSAKQFLGLPYVHVSAHSRHIQKSPFLQESAERAEQ
jgi:hypothetical protein